MHLQRRGTGYLFAAGPGMLDVVTFREQVAAAKAHLADQRPDAALDCYAQALSLWQDSAGAGLDLDSTALAVFATLDGEFFDAGLAATELAVSLGRPESVLPPVQLAARMAPLHEPMQAALISVLAAAGSRRQRCRCTAPYVPGWPRTSASTWAGPASRPPASAAPRTDRRPAPRPQPVPVDTAPDPTSAPPAAAYGTGSGRHAGRTDRGTCDAAAGRGLARTGGTGLVIVEGEPGAGKTRLLEEISAEASRRGALVVWGRCLEGDGTPSMWPWVQAVHAVLDHLPDVARQKWLAGDLGRLVEPRDGVLTAPVLPGSGAQSVCSSRSLP